jgi:hypothetical protein
MKSGMSKRTHHGGYNKVHPKWLIHHTCNVCGKDLIANGINWHNENCSWKGIDMDKVYDAIKNNWSTKRIMETYGTSMYTTNMMKKGFYPKYPSVDSDGRRTIVQPKRSYGGHTFKKVKTEVIPTHKIWERIEMGLDVDGLYEKKKRKNYTSKKYSIQ